MPDVQQPVDSPATPAPHQRRLLGAFSHRDFRNLLIGTMGSQMGDWVQMTGQGWLVYVLTGSAGQLGTFIFVRGMAQLILTPLGGGIADRMSRRDLLSYSTLIGAISAVILAILVATGWVRVWHLYVTGTIDGLVAAMSQPARQVMVYDTVGNEDLTNAIAINAIGGNLTRIVGPAIAGVLIGIDVSTCFFTQAGFYVLASISTFLIRTPGPPVEIRASFLRSLGQGARYAVRQRDLLALFTACAVPAILVYPYFRFIQVFAINVLHIGAVGYGVLLTAGGVGSIAGGAWVATLGNYRHKGVALMLGNIIYCAFLVLFALAHQPVLAFIYLAAGGIANSVYLTLNQTLLQLKTEDEYRGRVLALYLTIQGLMPPGSLLMGFMIDRWGAPHVVAGWATVAATVMTLLLLRSKRIRAM